MNPILFYFFAGLAVATAMGVVAFKNPISSAFSLVVSFFAMAALYAGLDAHFLAVIQILVYAGAIMVLFIFVIMLLNLKPDELQEKPFSNAFTWVAGAGVAVFLGFLFFILGQLKVGPFAKIDATTYGTVKQVGELLFQNYWFPFELVSILLTVAVVGGVVLAKREL